VRLGFSVSTTWNLTFVVVLHITQAFVHRTHWLLWTAVLCGITELFGWSARLWSAIDPLADDAFIMQYVQSVQVEGTCC